MLCFLDAQERLDFLKEKEKTVFESYFILKFYYGKKLTFPTHWAVSSCFFLLKSLCTLNADAHVSAGHDHGVYEICHAYDALFIAVFHAERTQNKFKQQKIIMILEKYERNKLKKGMLFGCT